MDRPGLIALFVSIVVPPEDKPGGSADLQQAKRQTGAPYNVQESAEQRRTATHLIRLDRGFNQIGQFLCMLVHCGLKPTPEVWMIGVATDGWVGRRQLRRFALQHKAVDRA